MSVSLNGPAALATAAARMRRGQTPPRDPPEVRHGSLRLPKARHRSLRLLLALVTLVVLASPFSVAFYLNYRAHWIGPQLATPSPRLSVEQVRDFRFAAAIRRSAGEPIVLAYHDITWNSVSRYTVTPRAFASQLAMLRAAGYKSLTAAQLIRYLHGGPVPRRSVVITFDDGPRGLWTYADKIMQQNGFHGICFVITGRVGTHQPYYLTWQEIGLMYASGRWDFESHTNALHEHVLVGASGRIGDPLTSQIWLPSKHRRETMPEFRARVHADLLTSIAELRKHGLPRPALFAYPFSEIFGAPPYTASADANRLIRHLFAAAMTNYIDPPVPLSRREAASGIISRLEVFSSTTPESLFAQLRRIASLPRGDGRAVLSKGRWQAEDATAAGIRIRRGDLVFRGDRTRWAYAAFDPGATADWNGYRLKVNVTGLDVHANPSATISVRLGSPAQVNVSVANHYVKITRGNLHRPVLLTAKDLAPAYRHLIMIKVERRATIVMIDGHMELRRRVRPGPANSGGLAVASFRPSRTDSFARFDALKVARLPR